MFRAVTWCRWENARKGSSCGLDRIHSSDGAGTLSAGQLLTTTVGRRRLVLVRSLLFFFEANLPK
jgi:hypothetical protein